MRRPVLKDAKVLKDEATGMKLMVVSGATKEEDWKETHANALPNMFKVQRRIFAEQLELRFKVDGTPDKHTLLALKLRQHDAGRWHLLQAHGCATADGW